MIAAIDGTAQPGVSIPNWSGAVNPLERADLIQSSHDRSARYGLAVGDQPDFSPVSRSELKQRLDENHFLYQHAAPVMETLYGQIANTHSMVLLTARSGLILHSLGDSDFLQRASKVALMPGVEWSEKSKGTNAIGTALTEEQAIVIHGNEHYLQANHFLSCSCSPILDPHGKVVGALDVTGDERSFHQHTMALVRMSAQMIENQMFANVFPDAVRVHFHSRSEFLGTLVEGIAAFSHEGRFLSANRSAQFQLGLSMNALRAHTFSSLFGQALSQVLDRLRQANGQPVSLCLHNGVTVWCHSRVKPASVWLAATPLANSSSPVPVRKAETPSSTMNAVASVVEPDTKVRSTIPPVMTASSVGRTHPKPGLSGLRYLDTGDPQVAAVIRKLQLVRGRDIPIMILGETGTGKDILAQAIHHDSERAQRPFISVNCASIPENLIESELFGYEEGAFTGAKRKGSTGKILQANGGTLFLDEIGDMPTQLQARLLRVLQERRVNPLGSGKEYEVDVTIICATHRNLKELIAKGQFREDLYYRLNGLVVRLPALRHRTDFDMVVGKILHSLSERGQEVRIAPDVVDLFHRYAWPGNFRQLHNLLRTAVVMLDDEDEIQVHHLPDDFLDEVLVQGHAAAPLVPTAPLSHAEVRTPTVVVPITSPVVPELPSATAPVNHVAEQKLEDVTLQAMADALRRCRGNVSAAAKWLGVSRNTIYRKKAQLPSDVWH